MDPHSIPARDIPAGGSPWEPALPPGDVPPDPGQDAEPAAGRPAVHEPNALTRSKLVLVAGAIGLLAVGGIGGFVLGSSSSATAGTGTGQFGSRPGFDGGQGGFPGGQTPRGPISGGTGTQDGTAQNGAAPGTGPTT